MIDYFRWPNIFNQCYILLNIRVGFVANNQSASNTCHSLSPGLPSQLQNAASVATYKTYHLHRIAITSETFHKISLHCKRTIHNAREGFINKILFANDLVLINESIEKMKEKFSKSKKAFKSKGLKLNLKKTKVMVSDSKGEVLKSKVDSCAECGKRVVAHLVMCTKYGKLLHGRCEKIKKGNFNSGKGFYL